MDKLREELERVQVKISIPNLFHLVHSGCCGEIPDCSRENPAGAGQGPPRDRHPAGEDGQEHRGKPQGELSAETLNKSMILDQQRWS